MLITLSPDVKTALKQGRPVVALESTIIAHGMPFPQNLDMAQRVEQIISERGAVPATIAILRGELRAGLSARELEAFAKNGASIMKVSTRDIPFVVSKKLSGATTVASTMRLAAMVGIAVFATGGMGGVHRRAEKTFDISADLNEFAKSNVAVVTAGAKAILDLALTLEVLESLGVPVVGYGTDDFPAFYSRNSGLKTPMRLDTPREVAAMMKAKWALGLQGGIVVANPIPQDQEFPAHDIEPVILEALKAADREAVTGKQTTPYLLNAIANATRGKSLAANIALVENNARLAADVAVAYSQ